MSFDPRTHELRADLARVKEARDFADLCAVDFGFPADERYQLKLAMSEAVTNAIQHGSSSPQDPIWLRAAAEGDALAFYVRDTGRFIPRVTRGQLPESGRGLEFMRRLMDDVDLQPGRDGTELRFAKRRGEVGPGGGQSPPMQTVSG